MKIEVKQTLTKTFEVAAPLNGETIVDAFKRECWDPASLLKEFERWLSIKMSNGNTNDYKRSDKQIQSQLLSCSGWTTDGFEITKV